VSDPDSPEVQRARSLTAEYMKGGPRAFDAFRDLTQQLLAATVLADGQHVRLSGRGGRRGDDVRVLAGMAGPTDPLRLRDGRWLRLAVTLFLDRAAGDWLKVRKSSFQYQADHDGDQPIFRYDYLRVPHSTEPPAHLNLYGTLDVPDVLPPQRPLSRIHFPTSRVSMEAGIRLLTDDFAVPTATAPTSWRPLLAASETTFDRIAHRPVTV
jgi:hypothetical protein